jgi:hypothetical protein
MKYVVENGNIHEYQAGKYENGVIFPNVELAQEYVNFKQNNQKNIIEKFVSLFKFQKVENINKEIKPFNISNKKIKKINEGLKNLNPVFKENLLVSVK